MFLVLIFLLIFKPFKKIEKVGEIFLLSTMPYLHEALWAPDNLLRHTSEYNAFLMLIVLLLSFCREGVKNCIWSPMNENILSHNFLNSAKFFKSC